jgi:hypothetical protein
MLKPPQTVASFLVSIELDVVIGIEDAHPSNGGYEMRVIGGAPTSMVTPKMRRSPGTS